LPSFSGVIWFQNLMKSDRTAPLVVMLPTHFAALPPELDEELELELELDDELEPELDEELEVEPEPELEEELELLDDPVPPPVTLSETREGRPAPDPQKPKLVLPAGGMTASKLKGVTVICVPEMESAALQICEMVEPPVLRIAVHVVTVALLPLPSVTLAQYPLPQSLDSVRVAETPFCVMGSPPSCTTSFESSGAPRQAPRRTSGAMRRPWARRMERVWNPAESARERIGELP
jgi:hypothetical protein